LLDLRVLFFVLFFPILAGVAVTYFRHGRIKDYGLGLHGTAISVIVSVTPRVGVISSDLFLTHSVVLIIASICLLFTAGSYNRRGETTEKICFGLGFFFLIIGAAWATYALNLGTPASP
jgi:hypothetical protein